MDPHELMGAKWMGRAEIEEKIAKEGEALHDRVSPNNWKMILPALEGMLIGGVPMPRGGHLSKPAMLYTAGGEKAAPARL